MEKIIAGIRAALIVLMGLAAGAHAQEAPSSAWSAAAVRVVDTGLASMYTPHLQGRRTASGERYNHYALTAAHRTLPFGTRVRVDNLENGRSVTVEVNDRGPFVDGRVIDLSGEAARRLDMTAAGLARVRLVVAEPATEVARMPVPPASRDQTYVIQLASFQEMRAAVAMAETMEEAWVQAVDVRGARRYRVNYGVFKDAAAAQDARRALNDRGFDGLIKHLDAGAPLLPRTGGVATASNTPPAVTVIHNTWGRQTLRHTAPPSIQRDF